MATLLETLINTIAKDLEELESLKADRKSFNKEYSLIKERIVSAKKLIKSEENYMAKLLEFESKLQTLKNA